MSLAEEYKRQFGWRPWPIVLQALPLLAGQTVLDLGCAVGDQAAELVGRGARLIGVDANQELLDTARGRRIANAEFFKADLLSLPDLGAPVDGIWCSFTAAYFPDLPAALKHWGKHLRPGGWIALTEVDDLFGHEPIGAISRSLLDGYAAEALQAGRYDFHMGHKLAPYLEQAGFAVDDVMILEDQEFAFGGPASVGVLEAWRSRLDRMRLLRDYCGPRFAQVQDEFLGCLAAAEHSSRSRVYCCLATR